MRRRLWAALTASLLLGIAGYRRLVSPLLPPACRFHPSCSDYAASAIASQGPLRGVVLALKRLARCHPWHPGGFDPAPLHSGAPNGLRPGPGLEGR